MFKCNTTQTQSAEALNEVHTSNISKSFLRITIVYMILYDGGVQGIPEMFVKAMDKNVVFMHTFRIPNSSILMDGVIFV